MKLLIAFVILVFGGLFLTYFSSKAVPLQGMVDLEGGQSVLISRARPEVFFRPADDMILRAAGWKTVRQDTRGLDSESVRLSFAVYTREKGSVITALAETPGGAEWIAAHHVPYRAVWSSEEPYENERMYESVFVLDEKNDPFPESADAVGLRVAYRGKFLLFGRKMQVIVEYHEPIEARIAKNLDLENEYVKDFVERGRACCTIAFPSKKAMSGLKSRLIPLEPAGDAFSRQKLAVWLGELTPAGSHR